MTDSQIYYGTIRDGPHIPRRPLLQTAACNRSCQFGLTVVNETADETAVL